VSELNLDRLTERVRALLAKAEATSFPEEADTYREKAMALVSQYGIESAMLSAQRPTRETPTVRVFQVEAPYALDKIVLLNSLANALGCSGIRTSKHELTVFGFQSDLDRLSLLYNLLMVQAVNGALHVRIPNGISTVSYRKSWMQGFTNRVAERVREIEDRTRSDAESSSPGTELVLRDRAQDVDAALQRAFPRVHTSSRKLGARGYSHGRTAGDSADLGQDRLGERRAALR
jgi:Protein of unknown function (DUF2786)